MSDDIDRAAEVIYDALSGKYGDFNMPTDAARALDAAGLLRRPTDPEVDIETTARGRTCVVKVSGQVIFDGVGREASIRTKSAAEHDAAVAARALRDAASELEQQGVEPWDRNSVAVRTLRFRAERIEAGERDE